MKSAARAKCTWEDKRRIRPTSSTTTPTVSPSTQLPPEAHRKDDAWFLSSSTSSLSSDVADPLRGLCTTSAVHKSTASPHCPPLIMSRSAHTSSNTYEQFLSNVLKNQNYMPEQSIANSNRGAYQGSPPGVSLPGSIAATVGSAGHSIRPLGALSAAALCSENEDLRSMGHRVLWPRMQKLNAVEMCHAHVLTEARPARVVSKDIESIVGFPKKNKKPNTSPKPCTTPNLDEPFSPVYKYGSGEVSSATRMKESFMNKFAQSHHWGSEFSRHEDEVKYHQATRSMASVGQFQLKQSSYSHISTASPAFTACARSELKMFDKSALSQGRYVMSEYGTLCRQFADSLLQNKSPLSIQSTSASKNSGKFVSGREEPVGSDKQLGADFSSTTIQERQLRNKAILDKWLSTCSPRKRFASAESCPDDTRSSPTCSNSCSGADSPSNGDANSTYSGRMCFSDSIVNYKASDALFSECEEVEECSNDSEEDDSETDESSSSSDEDEDESTANSSGTAVTLLKGLLSSVVPSWIGTLHRVVLPCPTRHSPQARKDYNEMYAFGTQTSKRPPMPEVSTETETEPYDSSAIGVDPLPQCCPYCGRSPISGLSQDEPKPEKAVIGISEQPVQHSSIAQPDSSAKELTRLDIIRCIYLDVAVTTIQRVYRGRLGRRRAKYCRQLKYSLACMDAAARVIQLGWRRSKQMWNEEFENLVRLHMNVRQLAAIKIQRAWRNFKRRDDVTIERLSGIIRTIRHISACQIQRVWRSYRTRKVVDEEWNDWVIKWMWDPPGKVVEVVGDFSKPPWTVRHLMTYCPIRECYICKLPRVKGKYELKFIVDGRFVCCGASTVVEDGGGNFNNVVEVFETPSISPFKKCRAMLALKDRDEQAKAGSQLNRMLHAQKKILGVDNSVVKFDENLVWLPHPSSVATAETHKVASSTSCESSSDEDRTLENRPRQNLTPQGDPRFRDSTQLSKPETDPKETEPTSKDKRHFGKHKTFERKRRRKRKQASGSQDKEVTVQFVELSDETRSLCGDSGQSTASKADASPKGNGDESPKTSSVENGMMSSQTATTSSDGRHQSSSNNKNHKNNINNGQ